MKRYLLQWNWRRLAFLLVGIIFLGNFYEEGGFFNIFLGATLCIQAIFNLGCFFNRQCAIPKSPQKSN